MSLATATLQYTLATHYSDEYSTWLDLLIDNEYLLSLFQQIKTYEELEMLVSNVSITSNNSEKLINTLIDMRDHAYHLVNDDDDFIDHHTSSYSYSDSDTGYNRVTDVTVDRYYDTVQTISELFPEI